MVSETNCIFKVRSIINYLYYIFCSLKFLLHNDIKTNPDLNESHTYFSCCHWNLNRLIADNMQKVSLLDFIYISETSFNSSVDTDDDSLRISG